MNEAENLATLFEKFPGIGPRQARRFVYFLLKSGGVYRGNLEQAIQNLAKNIHECTKCQRYYSGDNPTLCGLCSNTARNTEQLLILEKDADLDQLEKSGAYSGRYFVLGARVKLTDSSGTLPNQARLLSIIKDSSDLKEVILALPTTTEGEHTSQTVQNIIRTFLEDPSMNSGQGKNIKITMLGRGLSTGAELEYADGATLKSALESRG